MPVPFRTIFFASLCSATGCHRTLDNVDNNASQRREGLRRVCTYLARGWTAISEAKKEREKLGKSRPSEM